MATLIHGKTGRTAYPDIVRQVVMEGSVRSPRGLVTRDLGNVTIHLDSPHDALPVGCGRGLNTRIAAAEAVQLIGAFSNPDLMMYASPNFKRYIEPENFFWGAYGTRVGDQVYQAVRKLRNDPSTRQAVVTLWDNQLDNFDGKKDYPCTVGFNFTVDKDKLSMNVLMRSNDVWLGLPYDMFQFTQLQLSVAHSLDLLPGTYTHTAWSLHIYEEHVPKAYDLHDPSPKPEYDWCPPTGIGKPGQPIQAIMDRAQNMTYGPIHGMTDSEIWYCKQFVDFNSPVVD